jgi:C1A family cysteine protease
VQDSFVFTVGGQEVPNRFCLSLIRENGWLYWDYGNYSSGRIDMPLPYNYLDQWIHVSVVSEGKSGKFMGIYLNGVLVKSIQKSDGPTIALKGLWIGKFLQEFQKGKISEFRIWNKVCSSDEIQENMFKQLTGSEDGLVGYWAFDEGEGNKVADKTKFNNSGVLSGNPKPNWEDLNKSEDANVKRWVCKEKLAQTSASVPKTAFIMMHSLVSQEYSMAGNQETAEDQKTQSLQFPILRKYLHNIQKANLGDNSNEEDDSRHLIILPEYVDLSFWCSPVEDQGSLNSCTANAAIALMEYFQKKSFGKYIDGSRLFLYKATRNLMQIEGNVGTSIRSTMKAMALFGVPPEEYWPYQEDKVNEEPIPFCYAFAQNYQALKYFRLDAAGIQPNLLLAQIKAILVAGIPCVFGFTLYHSIYDYSNPRGHIPFPHKRDKAEGGHAVVAVGYDDYKQIKNADGDESKGALLIRNCWGTKWGEGGYGWLPYEYVLKGLTADWWSLLSSEWFDTEQFGLGGKDWTDNVGTPDGQNQS